jgi:hypothetical protein
VEFSTAQVIAGALISGSLVFAAVAFVIGWGQPVGDPLLAYMAVGVSIIDLFASFVVPAIGTNQNLKTLGRQDGAVSTLDLFGVFQTRLIVRFALLEGAAFFCCIAYLSTRLWWSLATALVLIAMMAVVFPTRGRFDDWVRQQRELRSFDSSPNASGAM